MPIMKNLLFSTASFGSCALLLIQPVYAPAQPVNAPVSPVRATPRAVVQAAPIEGVRGSQIQRVAPALNRRVSPIQPSNGQVLDQEVCIFKDANFQGWKFCTMLGGLQALPAPYQRQATSMTIPSGFLLRLFERADGTGAQCVFYGQVGQVSRDCDNITGAISFEVDQEWVAKQAAAQRQRELEEAEAQRQQQRVEREAVAAEEALPRAYAPQDVCLFEHANFGGWRYCTNLRNFQTLPSQFQGQASSAKIPDGYRVVLFERSNKSGISCFYWGEVSEFGGNCNDMTLAMKLEPDPDYLNRRAEARQRADQEERDQADAARRAERERRRKLETSIGGPFCPIEVHESDGSWESNLGGTDRLCILYPGVTTLDSVNVKLNDDIEKIAIYSGYASVTFYEHINFGGRSFRLECGIYNLEGEIEDEISSIKVEILEQPSSNRCDPSVVHQISRWDR
jgi:hypothetical protein